MQRPNADLFDGFLLATGLGLTLDNLVFHWGLRWHRLAPYPWTDLLEMATFIAGLIILWFVYRRRKSAV